MPRVKPSERRRARRPKTRTGCITCKIRRVKCDEAKPSCCKCTSTGRKCDGYESGSSDSELVLVQIDPISKVFASAKEHRAFDFFQKRTGFQLSGFDESDFWNGIILQAAHVDPGIRCAIVALGSLHEGFEKRGDSEQCPDDFALKQYNLAIRHHLDNVSSFAKDTTKLDNYIVSSIIFMCIELIQGHYLSALSLVKGAVKLFYECTVDFRRKSPWPLEIFDTLLSRLQAQAVGLVGHPMVGATVPPRVKAVVHACMPKRFVSITEAKDWLEFYSNTHVLSKPAEKALDLPWYAGEPFDTYLDLLHQWSSAFDAMLAHVGEDISERDRRAMNVLKVWQLMMDMGIHMALTHPNAPNDQTFWDNYHGTSERVVELAESIIGSPQGRDKGLHQFTLDWGVVGPLYDTARTCRDPVIRRKAISLLRMYPCREGLWDSLLAARAAERQMELEEAALPEVNTAADIPGWARITSVVPTFQFGERWAALMFTGQRDHWSGDEPESFHETIEW